ncbi:MAG: enoyl-[acyl-carrier-protein] reductase FabL [Ignavibacteria bacterium]|nr:MAG: enoyl-[acyl-carrier-protein] reductase FabL [Ignavibacteria bacterium]
MPERHPWLRHVVITGGTRGIGRSIALSVCSSGAHSVLLNYLQNDEAAQETKARCEELGAQCVLHRGNVGSPDEIDRLFDVATEQLGSIDLLVHCAALNSFKPITAIKPNQWDLTVNIAARAFLLCAQRCAPLMERGSIIAVSSLGARRVLENYGAMGPAKAALESIVQYLAVEMAPRGIRVNGITAGLVETESLSKFPAAEQMIEAAKHHTPAGRIGTPGDIARVVHFLAGPDAAWIVGQTLVADGGFSLR